MKCIFPMLVVSLSLLTACSDGGGKSGAQKFRDALKAVPRGLIMNETFKGTHHDIDYTSGTPVVNVSDIDSTSHYVILKIEGNAMYRLRAYDLNDLNGRRVEKVLLKSPVGSSWSSTGWTESGESGRIDAKWDIQTRVNQQNPYCDAEEVMAVSDAKLTFNGVVTPLPNTLTKRTFTCGRTLSAAELKALDLSDMTICDDTDAESEDETTYDCQSNQNLEHLTSDL